MSSSLTTTDTRANASSAHTAASRASAIALAMGLEKFRQRVSRRHFCFRSWEASKEGEEVNQRDTLMSTSPCSYL